MTADSRTVHRRLRAIEHVLMVVAMIALGWYAGVRLSATLDHASDERAFDEIRVGRPAAFRTETAASRPALPVRPAGILGRIEAPRLGLFAVVREGTDARTLRRAVGHIADTARPGSGGNVVLAAHRDTFFRPLKDVRRGDRIRVTTSDGAFTYVVRETRVVAPDDVSVLDPTPAPTLTLVTCYPFNYIGAAPKRFVVRATETTEIDSRRH